MEFAENNKLIMGCAPQKKSQPLQRKESPVGILKVTILGVVIHNHEKIDKANIKIRVSNQHFETGELPPISKDKVAGETFTYAINSFYKPHGRVIEVGFFSGNTLISFGAVDANPAIERKGPLQSRCILSKEQQKEDGYILLRITFDPLPYYDLTFRFEQATIRRKTGGTCGQDNVAVRLTIGQQVRQTEFQKDALETPPVWHDTKYNFKVPEGINKGFLELVDDRNNIIGSTEINLQQCINVKEEDEIIQNQSLFFKENDKQIIAADLKYSFILGQYANFKPRTQLFASSIRAIRPKNQFSESRTQNLK